MQANPISTMRCPPGFFLYKPPGATGSVCLPWMPRYTAGVGALDMETAKSMAVPVAVGAVTGAALSCLLGGKRSTGAIAGAILTVLGMYKMGPMAQ